VFNILYNLNSPVTAWKHSESGYLKNTSFRQDRDRFGRKGVSEDRVDVSRPLTCTAPDVELGAESLNRTLRTGPQNNAATVVRQSIQIQVRFALITFYDTTKNSVSASRTYIAGFFVLDPLFSANLSPIRNSPQNYLFADSHRKIVDVLTRKFITLMASGVAFLFCTGSYFTCPAMQERFI